MTTTKIRKRTPKSQSEKAADKKSRALERAGTAVIDGKPEKAKKILDRQKKRESKKPTQAQAVEIVSEARAIEAQITATDLKIDGVKEQYKQLKSHRELLVTRLREEVRNGHQGRLPFGGESPNGAAASEPKAKDEKSQANGAAPSAEPKGDAIEKELAEIGAKSELDAAAERGAGPSRELA